MSDTIAIVVFFATVFMKSLLRSPIEQFPLNNIIQVENKVGGCDVVNSSSQGGHFGRDIVIAANRDASCPIPFCKCGRLMQ